MPYLFDDVKQETEFSLWTNSFEVIGLTFEYCIIHLLEIFVP